MKIKRIPNQKIINKSRREKRKMNKGLQIYQIKRHLGYMGIKDDLEKIDFDAYVESTLTYHENLDIILKVVKKGRLVEQGSKPDYWLMKNGERYESIAEYNEKEHKSRVFQETLRTEFNNEGFGFSSEDFAILMDKCSGLSTPANVNLGVRSIVPEPLTQSPDYATMEEIIDMLKSNRKPQKTSSDERVKVRVHRHVGVNSKSK